MSVAKQLLRDRTTSAVALLRAADALLGDWTSWEPESVWLELEHQGVDVPEETRDRLMAAHSLRLVPAFYWDAVAFEKTCVTFDGQLAHVEILEEAAPSAMAWGVYEAAWIRRLNKDQDLRMEHEPIAYVAVVLERAGFVLAPSLLSFAQETLDARIRKPDFLREVERRWAGVDKNAVERLTLQETRVDVQIARLAAVELHIKERRSAAEAELTRLA